MNALCCLLAASAAFAPVTRDYKVIKKIPYYTEAELAAKGDYAHSRCLVDLRYPVGVTNYATVVNIHGGGLVAGGKHFAPWPKERAGQDPVADVAVGYRLLTNATPWECVSDAAAAVAWTLKHIAEYGGDPKKVFVTGISGGGYQTAMVGLDPKWLGAHGLKTTDLAGIAPFTGQMTKHFNVRKVGFKDNDPQFLPKIDEWAPLAYASTNPVPPTVFLTGGRDVEWKSRVEENALLESALRANGHKRIEFYETEGSHGGGVTPCSYFLRDFVMKTVDAGAVGRFAVGERVAFLDETGAGDGTLVAGLQLFAALRHPGWNVRCCRTRDSETVRADRVFVGASSDLRSLVDRLGARNVKRVLMTSSDVGTTDEAAEAVRALAAERSLGLVELRRPLAALGRPLSGRETSLLSAALVLQAMGERPLVAKTVIDAVKGKAAPLLDNGSRNVILTAVSGDPTNGVAFTYAPKALPLPATEAYRALDAVYPLTERFNREDLVVTGLAAGSYRVLFDGAEVGAFTAEELAKDVNVALLATPNQKLAQATAGLAEELAALPPKGCPLETADLVERIIAVRPLVSRVRVVPTKK